jgi:hypothetical protein
LTGLIVETRDIIFEESLPTPASSWGLDSDTEYNSDEWHLATHDGNHSGNFKPEPATANSSTTSSSLSDKEDWALDTKATESTTQPTTMQDATPPIKLPVMPTATPLMPTHVIAQAHNSAPSWQHSKVGEPLPSLFSSIRLMPLSPLPSLGHGGSDTSVSTPEQTNDDIIGIDNQPLSEQWPAIPNQGDST